MRSYTYLEINEMRDLLKEIDYMKRRPSNGGSWVSRESFQDVDKRIEEELQTCLIGGVDLQELRDKIKPDVQ